MPASKILKKFFPGWRRSMSETRNLTIGEGQVAENIFISKTHLPSLFSILPCIVVSYNLPDLTHGPTVLSTFPLLPIISSEMSHLWCLLQKARSWIYCTSRFCHCSIGWRFPCCIHNSILEWSVYKKSVPYINRSSANWNSDNRWIPKSYV